jgi:hypothetical protein
MCVTSSGPPPQTLLLKKVARYVERILRLIGLPASEIGLDSSAAAAATAAGQDSELMDELARSRTEVRLAAKAGLAAKDDAASKEQHRSVLALCRRCAGSCFWALDQLLFACSSPVWPVLQSVLHAIPALDASLMLVALIPCRGDTESSFERYFVLQELLHPRSASTCQSAISLSRPRR